jgi:hypothetical protein
MFLASWLGNITFLARIEKISYLSQSINRTRWERLNTHFYTKKTQEIRERSVEQIQSIGEEPRSRSRPKCGLYSAVQQIRQADSQLSSRQIYLSKCRSEFLCIPYSC